MDSIRLSQKHGVNPSLGLCFWCGAAKDVVLLGRLPHDEEAPRQAVYDYDPCAECERQRRQGITLIEARRTDPGDRLPLQRGVWPTGRWMVVKADAVSRLLTPAAMVEQVVAAGLAFLEVEAYDKLLSRLPPATEG